MAVLDPADERGLLVPQPLESALGVLERVSWDGLYR